ncbi:hypothetical protein BKA69DRAFT_866128 [Paraphysoderma sedebokerense]|nr:hypothetical protein BKA69DRAFT_866128 [Paraphysoderma sedebokerense]
MSHPTSRRAPVRSSYIGPGTSDITNAIREASSPGSTESNDNKTDQNRAGSNVSPSKRTIKRKMVNYEELAMLSTTEKEKKPVEIEIQEGKVQSIVEELSRSAESPPKEPIHYSPPRKQMQVTRQPSIQSTSSESSTAASVSSNAPVFASPLPPRVTTRKALDPTTVPPPVSRPPIHTDDVVHKPPTINIGRENIGNFGLGMTGANDRPTRARTATSKAEDVSHAVTGIVVGAGMAAKSLFHEAKNFFEDMAANPVEREEDIEKRMHQVAIDAQYEANVSMQELIEKYKRLRTAPTMSSKHIKQKLKQLRKTKRRR